MNEKKVEINIEKYKSRLLVTKGGFPFISGALPPF
jgi:hypothetical protein